MRQRVQRLLDAEVMQIVAVTDPIQVGFSRQAMIGIRVAGDLAALGEALSGMAEVDYVVTTAGSFDILAEVVCEDDDHLLDLLTNQIRTLPGRPVHRDLRLPEAQQAALQLGYPMSTYPSDVWEPSSDRHTATGALYSDAARDHLWMHFTRHSIFEETGAWATPCRSSPAARAGRSGTTAATSTSTASPGLFVVQVGHGRDRARRGDGQAGLGARLLPAVVLRAPPGHRARRAARRTTPPAT